MLTLINNKLDFIVGNIYRISNNEIIIEDFFKKIFYVRHNSGNYAIMSRNFLVQSIKIIESDIAFTISLISTNKQEKFFIYLIPYKVYKDDNGFYLEDILGNIFYMERIDNFLKISKVSTLDKVEKISSYNPYDGDVIGIDINTLTINIVKV